MIGKTIYNARKLHGLSQEELAEQAKVSVRTLQRIENDATTPRGTTLTLICEVLNIDAQTLSVSAGTVQQRNYGTIMIDYFFLAILNLMIMSVIGYMTLDSEANFNSKFGAVLLGFFIAYFVVTKTAHLSGTARLLKYGTGLIVYIISGTITHPFPPHLLFGFYPSIAVFLSVLFYGKYLVSSK